PGEGPPDVLRWRGHRRRPVPHRPAGVAPAERERRRRPAGHDAADDVAEERVGHGVVVPAAVAVAVVAEEDGLRVAGAGAGPAAVWSCRAGRVTAAVAVTG